MNAISGSVSGIKRDRSNEAMSTNHCRVCGDAIDELIPPVITPFCRGCSIPDCPDCDCVNFGWKRSNEQYECDNGCGPFDLETAMALDQTMNDRPIVYVVIEQLHGHASDRIRRVFTNEQASRNYTDDPENDGEFYVEEMRLNEEWPGHEP
jgi:hypothetical protein